MDDGIRLSGVAKPDNTNAVGRRKSHWRQQGRNLCRYIYSEVIKLKNVEKVFWAFFATVKEHWRNGIDYFGLYVGIFFKKPAFFAYKECSAAWEKRQNSSR